jgi:hypothetical protein
MPQAISASHATSAPHAASVPQTISARDDYARRLASAQAQYEELKARNAKLVWLRMGSFLLAALGLLLGYAGEQFRLFWQVVGWGSAGVFLVAIVWHEHVRLAGLKLESDIRLFISLLARLDRNWSQVPEQHLLEELKSLAYADDLDVAGPAGLLSLLSLAGTHPGRRILQHWLAEVPTWQTVRQRQAAIQTLSLDRELRLGLIQSIASVSDGSADVYGLPVWAQQPSWLLQHRLAHLLSYLGPAAVIAGFILLPLSISAEAETWTNIGTFLLAGGFLINILVTVFWGSWIHDIFQQITGRHRAVYEFAGMFSALSGLPTNQEMLKEIRDKSVAGPTAATRGFSKLTWIVRLANLQRDPVMYIVYLALQLIGLWDFRVLKLLELWKAEFGDSVNGWFDALGTCEALISCATLADENPAWAYPSDVSESTTLLRAGQLGHPLLPDTARVCNDLCLIEQQPLLLVTGSNMAGKSTFMRALGLNLLLARTGSPVCAQSLETPLYELATSIRVRDSLREGVSFFMAELKRLKEVVDLSEQHTAPGSLRIFFLLDEILQGTNSRERQIAVSSVLQRLLKCGSVGVVSTHDLDLAQAPEIKQVSQVVHFREYFESQNDREVMRFDYMMRPGSTPTTNALKLLKLVGLESDPAPKQTR